MGEEMCSERVQWLCPLKQEGEGVIKRGRLEEMIEVISIACCK